jgi:hypothetical protein
MSHGTRDLFSMEEELQKRRGRRKTANPVPGADQEYDFFLIRDVKAPRREVPEGEPEKQDPADKSKAFFLG